MAEMLTCILLCNVDYAVKNVDDDNLILLF